MTGRDFLESAGRLATSPEEADWRNAASRAYYAAFHVARDLLTALRFRVPRADRAHEYLYRRLNNCGHLAAQDAARLLHDLRTLRNRADYDLRLPFDKVDGIDSVDEAEQAIQGLEAVTPAEFTQITDAMKLYEQSVGDVTWQP
ncbi:MAG: HEPN domain-containing protein [Gemmataceae bacterium]